MKTKNVFYLCLIVAIFFFSLGGYAYSWAIGIGIGIGIYIGKIIFWNFLILFTILIFYLFTSKKKNLEN